MFVTKNITIKNTTICNHKHINKTLCESGILGKQSLGS